MPDKDPAKEKARKANIVVIKTAIRKAAVPNSDGTPKWVGFAFSPGDKPEHHTFMMNPRKKGPQVSKLLLKELAKDSKGGPAPRLCFGQATVGKAGGKRVIWIEYLKKLGGAERKMNEALKYMHLPFIVKLREEDDTGEAPPAPAPIGEEEDETEDTTDELEAADEEETEEDQADEEEETEFEATDEDEEEEEEDEYEEEEEEEAPQPAAQPAAAAQPQPQRTTTPYEDGAVIWSKTRALMQVNVTKFKTAVREEYKDEPPQLQAQINDALGKLDTMLEKFDDRLERSLRKAHAAQDEKSRKDELVNSKEIIKDYLKAMAAEPLVGHLDSNPFGVDMNVKLVLTKSLTQLAKTVS